MRNFHKTTGAGDIFTQVHLIRSYAAPLIAPAKCFYHPLTLFCLRLPLPKRKRRFIIIKRLFPESVIAFQMGHICLPLHKRSLGRMQ